MTLLYILFAVFVGVALMVIIGQKFGKPMSSEEQTKYAKIIPILVFILIIGAIVRELL
ncbi:MAG: hypothetical protein MJK12_19880 [Colwellia sp.]|nr:hypothetical protein [Colwellia sp.]